MAEEQVRVGILGAGRMATALAKALTAAPDSRFRLETIVARRQEALASIEAALRHAARGGEGALPLARMSTSPAAFSEAELVLLAVSDRQVVACAESLLPILPSKAACIFLAGSLPISSFAKVRDAGTSVALMHPLRSFPGGVEIGFEDCPMLVSGEGSALTHAKALSTQLGGRALQAERFDPMLYHAAAALLANGCTSLFAAAERLLHEASGGAMGHGEAWSLLDSAVRPLRDLAPEEALTGPVQRGDQETVAAHLRALESSGGIGLDLYRVLMQQALELAKARGLDGPLAARIGALLDR